MPKIFTLRAFGRILREIANFCEKRRENGAEISLPQFGHWSIRIFGQNNNYMIFGDAKDMLTQLLADLKEL